MHESNIATWSQEEIKINDEQAMNQLREKKFRKEPARDEVKLV